MFIVITWFEYNNVMLPFDIQSTCHNSVFYGNLWSKTNTCTGTLNDTNYHKKLSYDMCSVYQMATLHYYTQTKLLLWTLFTVITGFPSSITVSKLQFQFLIGFEIVKLLRNWWPEMMKGTEWMFLLGQQLGKLSKHW
jgi:hypothetical protein